MTLIFVLWVLCMLSAFMVCMYAVLIVDSEVQEWEEWNKPTTEETDGEEERG